MKAHSPLLGFNNNVKHKGRVFHIQTEDSGARHPHIISHLFADGGRILKTTKTSYAEHVGADRMADIVRGLMKEQHKAMFIALRDGEFDHLFEGMPGAAGSRPGVPPAPPSSTTNAAVDPAAPASPSPPAAGGKVQGVEAHAKTMPAPPKSDGKSEGKPGPQIHAPGSRGVSPTALTAAALEVPPPPPPKPDADLATLERAAAEPQSAVFQQIHDLPPPPAAVLGKKRPSDVPAGSYRTVSPQPTHVVNPPPPAPPSDPEGRAGKQPGSAGGAGRYAPTRPAAIFANARPADGASIFGEDLISEKSLDEVILSYLAEDLDSQPPKK